MKTYIVIGSVIALMIAALTAWGVFFGFALPTQTAVNQNAGPATGGAESAVVTEADRQAVVSKQDVIRVSTPDLGATIDSPVTITGEARGYWFFEASFPIALVNRSGQTIAEGIATAEGDWMTEDFVPFSATINFRSPYLSGDPQFMSHGAIVLIRDNPSDLPENDDQLFIPIQYAPNEERTPFSINIPTDVEVYDGITVKSNVRSLDLSGRGLTGSLKAEINQLTQLEELNLSDNAFTGLPAEIGQLSALRAVNLANNSLTGLPHELGNLQNLQTLDLRGTQYSEIDLNIISAQLPATTNVITDDTVAESGADEVSEETE